jgi:putative ABC transport system ATP-binding protein
MTEVVIEFKDIEKEYVLSDHLKQKVLKGISFSIFQGEFLSIMGPSGSGKSTTMNILGCLDSSTSGSYFLNGKDVSKMDNKEFSHIRNQQFGFVFQSFNLLGKRNLIDNVAMPLIYRGNSKESRNKRAIDMLTKVGLEDYIYYFPGQLSGGMKQRVAIARALVANPKIIFADEPTGNLDSKTGEEILSIFKELNEKLDITIIMITHELEIAAFTNRSIHIKDGEIIHDGGVDEIKN